MKLRFVPGPLQGGSCVDCSILDSTDSIVSLNEAFENI